ncbi:MAG: hypothetical protein KIT16_08345 [Rhodospirillaceae bacterium]|nr:hypothetical protein [Rhodospirillaceae bacterium]
MSRRPAARKSAKTTVDFATGEVHDRLIEAEAEPAEVALQSLTEDERRRAGLGQSSRAKRNAARKKAASARRNWVRERKIP